MLDLREIIPTAKKFSGLRQVKREIGTGKIAKVILASDAGSVLKSEIENLCKTYTVELVAFPSKGELGRLCGIEVGCAVVGLTV